MRSNRYLLWFLLLLLLTGSPLAAQYPDAVWVVWPRESAIRTVTFSPDSRRLALATYDGTVEMRDVSGGEIVWSRPGKTIGQEPPALAFTASGTTLLHVMGGADYLDTETGELVVPTRFLYSGPGYPAITRHLHVAYIEDAPYGGPDSLGVTVRAALDGDTTVRLWRSKYLTGSRYFTGVALAITRGGDRVALGSNYGPVHLFDGTTGDSLWMVPAHATHVAALTFSPDGRYLASGGGDYVVKILDVATGQIVKRLVGHHDAVNAIDFSSDGKYLVSASYDGTIRVWNVETGENVHTYGAFAGNYFSVAFSPDMRYILSGTLQGALILWNARYTNVAGVEHATGERRGDLALTGAAPNPFHTEASITFTLASRKHVTVEVFDLFGERVAMLADEMMEGGAQRITWSAEAFPAGIYHYRVTAEGKRVTGRMIKK